MMTKADQPKTVKKEEVAVGQPIAEVIPAMGETKVMVSNLIDRLSMESAAGYVMPTEMVQITSIGKQLGPNNLHPDNGTKVVQPYSNDMVGNDTSVEVVKEMATIASKMRMTVTSEQIKLITMVKA